MAVRWLEPQFDAGEIAREINAVFGLLHFARERCYPDSLIGRLNLLLEEYADAAARIPVTTTTAAPAR